jgi:hypothetical protein
MTEQKQDKEIGFDVVLEKSGAGVQAGQAPSQDPLATIPRIFCADRDTAKQLLVDIFALTGALRGIEIGNVDPKTTKLVLSNGQKMISMLGDIMIRDCNLTETDINDVSKVFEQKLPTPSKKE